MAQTRMNPNRANEFSDVARAWSNLGRDVIATDPVNGSAVAGCIVDVDAILDGSVVYAVAPNDDALPFLHLNSGWVVAA